MDYYEITYRIQKFQALANYSLLRDTTHRTWEICGSSDCMTFKNSDVFISGIPSDTLEDELIPFFATIGIVVKFKLLTLHNSLYNSGFAVVTYCDSSVAETAIKMSNYIHFKGITLTVEKVTDNCRLFLGGIPETKSKDEVWQALNWRGITGIVDVIMYRSYRNRAYNRGYVFVEFHTFVEAAQTRILHKNLILWGERMAIDWSEPIPSVTDNVMSKVKKLFIRNIEVTMSKNCFELLLRDILGNIQLEKVYKFKDYAFIHFRNKCDAEYALELLRETFKNSFIEICWATPQEFAPRKKRYLAAKFKPKKNFRQLHKQPAMQQAHCVSKCNEETSLNEDNILDALHDRIISCLNSLVID